MRFAKAKFLLSALVVVLVAASLSGCSIFDTNKPIRQATESAKRGVAYTTCDMAVRFGELALSIPPGSMTAASLDGVAIYGWIGQSDNPANYVPVNPYYSPDEPGPGDPSSSSPAPGVYWPSAAPGVDWPNLSNEFIYSLNSGMATSSVGYYAHAGGSAPVAIGGQVVRDVYGCAVLSLAYQTRTVAVTDEACPVWLVPQVEQMPYDWSLASVADAMMTRYGVDQWQVEPFVPADPYYGPPELKEMVPWAPSVCQV